MLRLNFLKHVMQTNKRRSLHVGKTHDQHVVACCRGKKMLHYPKGINFTILAYTVDNHLSDNIKNNTWQDIDNIYHNLYELLIVLKTV